MIDDYRIEVHGPAGFERFELAELLREALRARHGLAGNVVEVDPRPATPWVRTEIVHADPALLRASTEQARVAGALRAALRAAPTEERVSINVHDEIEMVVPRRLPAPTVVQASEVRAGDRLLDGDLVREVEPSPSGHAVMIHARLRTITLGATEQIVVLRR